MICWWRSRSARGYSIDASATTATAADFAAAVDSLGISELTVGLSSTITDGVEFTQAAGLDGNSLTIAPTGPLLQMPHTVQLHSPTEQLLHHHQTVFLQQSFTQAAQTLL
jgi:hypothetical protein